MSKRKWIISAVVLFGVAFGLGYGSVVYEGVGAIMEQMRKGELEVELPEEAVEQINEIDLESVNYRLIEGWNLVAFPVKPIEFDTAAGLMTDILNKGGYVTTVSVWDGDDWQEYAQRGKTKFGFDFEIEAGKSYFLLSQQDMDWRVAGDKVEESREYKLEPGWNTIGFVKEGMDARRVIDDINQGQEKATVLDWWTTASQWELYIKRFLSEDDVREYGENFAIEVQKGYMIFVNQALDWRLE
jgi:hypothetical protein